MVAYYPPNNPYDAPLGGSYQAAQEEITDLAAFR